MKNRLDKSKKKKTMCGTWDELGAVKLKILQEEEKSLTCFMALQDEETNEHFHYDSYRDFDI